MEKDESLKWFILGNIISAENDDYTEETKQKVIRRMDKVDLEGNNVDWEWLLEPLGDDARKYIDLLK